MYNGLWCFKQNNFDNPYCLVVNEKPSPLTHAFDEAYLGESIDYCPDF